jgi:hypothetical protein
MVRRVREGATIKEAAAEVPVSVRWAREWRKRCPDFDASMRAAKRQGHITGGRKRRLIDMLAAGVAATVAVQAVGSTFANVHDWAARDPAFAAEYRRLIGPSRTVQSRVRFEALLRRLWAGEGLDAAVLAVGFDSSTPARWRRRGAVQWAAVERALAGRVNGGTARPGAHGGASGGRR